MVNVWMMLWKLQTQVNTLCNASMPETHIYYRRCYYIYTMMETFLLKFRSLTSFSRLKVYKVSKEKLLICQLPFVSMFVWIPCCLKAWYRLKNLSRKSSSLFWYIRRRQLYSKTRKLWNRKISVKFKLW